MDEGKPPQRVIGGLTLAWEQRSDTKQVLAFTAPIEFCFGVGASRRNVMAGTLDVLIWKFETQSPVCVDCAEAMRPKARQH